ncbi:hypothetical protein HMPREF9463_00461 [Collinsella sp. 4_8_47FAA]|nr:hypothetical protein HMPREF9463_00461 [Collinsella sp. 4_8_47FAA]
MLKFLNALAALAAVGTFVIAFLDSYEVRLKVRRRTRGADGGRHLRRKRKQECPGFGARAFNKTRKLGRPRSRTFTRGASFSIDIVSRIAQSIRDILKTQMLAYPRLDGAV